VKKVMWLGISAAEKTLTKENDEKLPTDFVQEVSILARLSHPSIVRLLCYVNEGSKCSVVLELMDKDLHALITKRMEPKEKGESPFSIDEVIDIMLQTAEGMDYLYRRRVLHRDLKSKNILVKCKEVDAEFIHVKVADFGLSKTKEKSITWHHPTWNQGTTRWMAPELIDLKRQPKAGKNDNVYDGSSNYPFQSDVFSFGMVCFEILTGDTPFANDLPNVVSDRILKGERPTLPPGCPSCLARLIKMCWRTKPEERPSFAEICRELRVMKGSLLMGKALSSIT
jgi:serine/threonine protein kinase